MLEAETDHVIVAVGPTAMRLLDCATKKTLVHATATGCCGSNTWTVHASGLQDVKATSRADAIGAMIDHALMCSDGGGYSTAVPHELLAQP